MFLRTSTMKMFAIFILIAFIVSVSFWPIPSVQASSDISFDVQHEMIISVPIGCEDGELGYGDSDIVKSGPTSFAVAENGDIYVLDNYNNRIAIFSDGKWIRNIDFSKFVEHGYIMTLYDNYIYLLDHNCFQGYSFITKISLEGEFQERYLFDSKDMPQNVSELTVINGQITAIYYKDSPDEIERSCYVLDNVTKCVVKSSAVVSVHYTNNMTAKISYSNNNWFIKIDTESAVITPIGKDSFGNLTVKYIDDIGETIRKYNVNGELIGVIFSDDVYKGTVYIRNNTFFTNDDGVLYMSIGYADRMVIAKAAFCSPSALEQHGQVNELYVSDLVQTKPKAVLATNFTQPSVTGAQAISTGNSMANLSWSIISTSNTTSTSLITVPSPYLNASVGTSFIGIPYCWGGMMGTTAIGSSEYMKKFTDAISSGYKAGNINTSNNYISNSAGNDCSGFVARCYGHTTKNNTSWYLNSFGHAYDNYSFLQPGDYLVKNGHMMLVVQRIDASHIRVLESTTQNGINKNINRIITSTYFNNFTPMSAYHRAGNTWYYTSTQHYHKCRFAGCTSTIKFDSAAHNFVLNSSQTLYICTVCGYSTSAGGGTTAMDASDIQRMRGGK